MGERIHSEAYIGGAVFKWLANRAFEHMVGVAIAAVCGGVVKYVGKEVAKCYYEARQELEESRERA